MPKDYQTTTGTAATTSAVTTTATPITGGNQLVLTLANSTRTISGGGSFMIVFDNAFVLPLPTESIAASGSAGGWDTTILHFYT